MTRFAERTAKRLNRSPAAEPTSISRCLDADSQSYVGAIPATRAGRDGHLAVLDIYFDLIAEAKPGIFCDIGANKGEAGRRALALRPDMAVFGFEANPNIHSRYSDVNVKAGVQWINCAVANQDGTLQLYIPKVLSRALKGDILVARRVVEAEDTGKSSLLKRDESAEYETVDVRAVALDGFLQDHAPQGRVALWIDVEGAASLVLQGATATLARTDVVIVEVEGFSFWQDQALVMQVMDRLYQAGFVPVLRDREYQDAQFNIIFLRNSDKIDAQRRWIGDALDKRRAMSATATASAQPVTPATVPVLIPCFNNPSYAAAMLAQLQSLGFTDITFVDNASSSAPMHDWLDQTARRGIRVERLTKNLGPRKSVFTRERLENLPQWFCVTDPDLEFNPALPKDFLQIMADAITKHGIAKAGFALDIGNREGLRQDKFDIEGNSYHIWEWEKQFWNTPLDLTASDDTVFEALTDTTFALYDLTKFRKKDKMRALRIGGRFTAKHLPWLTQPSLDEDEATLYRDSQKFSFYARGLDLK